MNFTAHPKPSLSSSIMSLSSLPHLFLPLSFPTTTTLSTILGSYLLFTHLLRYRRSQALSRTYATPTSLSRMTIPSAQSVINQLAELEFSFTYEKGLQFALFRTYGIPSISSLLASTSLFSSPCTASKRYADTVVLVAEFIAREYGSPAWVQALARLNCIHGTYRRPGRITEKDMLYTLALFVREPWQWIERWEWRPLNEAEKCATGVFWAAIGEGMEIDFEPLWEGKSNEQYKMFKDGLHFVDAICAWAEQYERKHMVPNETNHTVAQQTVALLLYLVPSPLKGWGEQAVYTLMDTRLRRAMLYPDPPSWLTNVAHSLLHFRAFAIRHFFPPRFGFSKYQVITKQPTREGNYFLTNYLAQPHYVKPTVMSRWGPAALVRKAQGLPVPGDGGEEFIPAGYNVPHVGPGHGKKEQAAMEKRVAEIAGRGQYPACFVASQA